jgi:hypothetical protein
MLMRLTICIYGLGFDRREPVATMLDRPYDGAGAARPL